MSDFSKNLGTILAILVLVPGAYLIYDALSNLRQDPAASLLLGAALCSLGLVAAISSARAALQLREWKRHVHHE